MKCSICGAVGPCWYNKARKLVCKACRDAEAHESYRASIVGQRRIWNRSTNYLGGLERVLVTVVDVRGAWLIVRREDDGSEHRVRNHNLSR